MKEKISSVYKWTQKARRYTFLVLIPLALFCGFIWWKLLLDGQPSELTVRGGFWGCLILIFTILKLEVELAPPRLAKGILQTNHGDTIKKVIEEIRDEPVRYVAVFCENGKKICEYTELCSYKVSTDSVITQLITLLDEDAIAIFIHPIVNSDGYSRAFDEDELKTIVRGKITTAIIVSPDMTYTLRIPRKDDPKQYWKRVRKRYKIATDKAKWFFALGRSRKRLRSIKVIEDIADKMNWDFKYEEYQHKNEAD